MFKSIGESLERELGKMLQHWGGELQGLQEIEVEQDDSVEEAGLQDSSLNRMTERAPGMQDFLRLTGPPQTPMGFNQGVYTPRAFPGAPPLLPSGPWGMQPVVPQQQPFAYGSAPESGVEADGVDKEKMEEAVVGVMERVLQRIL